MNTITVCPQQKVSPGKETVCCEHCRLQSTSKTHDHNNQRQPMIVSKYCAGGDQSHVSQRPAIDAVQCCPVQSMLSTAPMPWPPLFPFNVNPPVMQLHNSSAEILSCPRSYQQPLSSSFTQQCALSASAANSTAASRLHHSLHARASSCSAAAATDHGPAGRPVACW